MKAWGTWKERLGDKGILKNYIQIIKSKIKNIMQHDKMETMLATIS